MRKLATLFLIILTFAGTSMATNDHWWRQMSNGYIGFDYNNTISAYQLLTTNKVSWTSITDAPAALGGGTTIPITNTTGGNSTACTSTDKVSNVTLKNGLLTIVCTTDQNTGTGGSGSNVTLPINYTNLTGTITLGATNITGDLSSWNNDITLDKANITNFAISGLAIANITAGTFGAGYTWNGNVVTSNYIGSHQLGYSNLTGTASLTLSNITGGTSIQCATNDLRMYNVTLSNGVLSAQCGADATGGAGQTSVGITPWLYNQSQNMYFNETYYNLTIYPIFFNKSSGIQIPKANITDLSITGLAIANITAGTFGAGYTWNGNTITSNYIGSHQLGYSNLTGTLISFGYANLTGTVNIGYANLTGTATLSATNITAGVFPTGQYTIGGNLGIGENTAGIPFEVYNNSGNNELEFIKLKTTGTSTGAGINLTFYEGTTKVGTILTKDMGTSIRMTLGSYSTSISKIDETLNIYQGGVGIGSQTPNDKLEVNGTIRALSNITIYGNPTSNSTGINLYDGSGTCKGYIRWNGTGILINASGC